MLPYGKFRKPDAKQYVTCQKSGKKKSASSKKSCCPFSMIYKKAYLGTTDPRMHPAFNGSNGEEIMKDQSPQIGIYFLSKYRGLHNHPLEMAYVFTPPGLTDHREREVMGHYEYDALNEVMLLPECTERFQRTSEMYLFKLRDIEYADVQLMIPEGAPPQFIQFLEDNEELAGEVDWGSAIEMAINLHHSILQNAYDSVKKDFSKKTSVFIYQGQSVPNFGSGPNDVKVIEFANEITIEIPKSRLIKSMLEEKKKVEVIPKGGNGKKKRKGRSSEDDDDESDDY
ncbi:hypothetical protein FGO68_gene16440 [Halteria grandinella]|uniref:Uncharacterized protein n=1 Tax=Halteria grandinella TaxID=5974 RepID=A0A8J8T4K4_HALGN|nr:hypothetical protein FGO68_gene16440 [Halteria grandinella]